MLKKKYQKSTTSVVKFQTDMQCYATMPYNRPLMQIDKSGCYIITYLCLLVSNYDSSVGYYDSSVGNYDPLLGSIGSIGSTLLRMFGRENSKKATSVA